MYKYCIHTYVSICIFEAEKGRENIRVYVYVYICMFKILRYNMYTICISDYISLISNCAKQG